MKYSLLLIPIMMIGCASNPREEESHNRLERIELKQAEQKELLLELKDSIKVLTEGIDENLQIDLQQLKDLLDQYNEPGDGMGDPKEQEEESPVEEKPSKEQATPLEEAVTNELVKIGK